jgi:hypothetical protein
MVAEVADRTTVVTIAPRAVLMTGGSSDAGALVAGVEME